MIPIPRTMMHAPSSAPILPEMDGTEIVGEPSAIVQKIDLSNQFELNKSLSVRTER